MEANNIISLNNISLTLPGPGKAAVCILHDVTMQVQKGDAVSITGASGSGKTSLMMLIAGVEKATSGRVKFQSLPKAPAAPPGTFDAVRDGLVDLSYVTASYTPARHVMPLMAELPGAGDTAEINSVAFSRIHWK